jgi:hypothetical protein
MLWDKGGVDGRAREARIKVGRKEGTTGRARRSDDENIRKVKALEIYSLPACNVTSAPCSSRLPLLGFVCLAWFDRSFAPDFVRRS